MRFAVVSSGDFFELTTMGTKQPLAVFGYPKGRPVNNRWLVIAHEASNSGAPRMLLDLLRGVRAHYGDRWECEILMDRGGPLLCEYKKLGKVHLLTQPWASGSGIWSRMIGARLDYRLVKPWRVRRLAAKWRTGGGGVIFSNTGINGRLLASIPENTGCVISYIHELEYSLRRFNRPRDLLTTLARTDLFLAVSSAAAHDLEGMGVLRDQIYQLPNFLPAIPDISINDNARVEVCRRLGLASDTRLIVGCGHVDPVKGTDIFEGISRLVLHGRQDKIAFLWAGGVSDPVFAKEVWKKSEGTVHYIGEVDSAALFLEAGAMGRPVLAFAEARGPADLLEPDGLVDGTSAVAMAAVVSDWLAHPEKARKCGERLRSKIAKGFLAEKWIGEVVKIMEDAHRA